ncbi:hypothetical protein BAC1_01027 [uncultured bacterium]|nr:hypothetical protein BAC1_01027 [uncultured bacterium]
MTNSAKPSGFFLSVLLLLFVSSAAWAVEGRHFGPDGLKAWTVQGKSAVEAGPAGLTLKGRELAALIPPKGTALSGSVLGLNISSATDALLTIYVRSNGKVFPERVNVRAGQGKGPALYRFLTGEDEYGPAAELAAIEIRAARVDFAVHSLSLAPATGTGYIAALWEEFWRPAYINAATITTIETPQFMGVSFQVYLLFIVALLVPFFLFAVSKTRPSGGLQAAVLFAFIAAGTLSAVRMDYNWLAAWGDESGRLSGREVAERVRSVNGGWLDELLEQAEYMKKNLPEDATVRLAEVEESSRLASIGRYYLLPLRVSSDAGYVWTYRTEGLSLDGSSLMKGGRVIATPVRLVKDFGEGSALFIRKAAQ